MLKTILISLVTLSAVSAYAGSSNTSLSCSSASGKTVVAGTLPGQGEVSTNLQYSIDTNFIHFDSQYTLEAHAKLSAKNREVLITVLSQGDSAIQIRSKSAETTKLNYSSNGTSGSFIGILTGTHPGTGQEIPTPIELRCFVSDEI